MMFVGATETGLKFCGGNNYKLFLGLTIDNCGVKTLSDRWLGVWRGYFLSHGPKKGSLGYQILRAMSYWNNFVRYFVTLLTFGRYKSGLERNCRNCQETVKLGCGLGFHINQTMLMARDVRL